MTNRLRPVGIDNANTLYKCGLKPGMWIVYSKYITKKHRQGVPDKYLSLYSAEHEYQRYKWRFWEVKDNAPRHGLYLGRTIVSDGPYWMANGVPGYDICGVYWVAVVLLRSEWSYRGVLRVPFDSIEMKTTQ